jgi:hypothetical protein
MCDAFLGVQKLVRSGKSIEEFLSVFLGCPEMVAWPKVVVVFAACRVVVVFVCKVRATRLFPGFVSNALVRSF